MYFYFSLLDIPQYTWIPNGFSLGKKIHTFGGSISHRQLMKECVMYFGEVYNMGLIELQHNWLWMPFPFVSQKNLWYNHHKRTKHIYIYTACPNKKLCMVWGQLWDLFKVKKPQRSLDHRSITTFTICRLWHWPRAQPHSREIFPYLSKTAAARQAIVAHHTAEYITRPYQ